MSARHEHRRQAVNNLHRPDISGIDTLAVATYGGFAFADKWIIKFSIFFRQQPSTHSIRCHTQRMGLDLTDVQQKPISEKSKSIDFVDFICRSWCFRASLNSSLICLFINSLWFRNLIKWISYKLIGLAVSFVCCQDLLRRQATWKRLNVILQLLRPKNDLTRSRATQARGRIAATKNIAR